jgi:crotonobetainyl-CoA:carnitine CoA-transferase CaiB-like acyl-CoA transferase
MPHQIYQSIGNPTLSKQKEYATMADRKRNEDALESVVSAWTMQYAAEEAEAVLQKARVPAHKVHKAKDVFDDPQLKHRKYFVPLNHPSMGEQKYEVQSCFILHEPTRRRITKPSPCLGEHNEYVFKKFLKLTDDEIAEHIIDGSITTEIPGGMKISM